MIGQSMLGGPTEFIKTAGLITVLHFLILTICVLIGLGLSLLARTRSAMWWFLVVGIVPILSGILAMYLKYKYANLVMMGMSTPQTIAANRREGLVDFVVGATGSIVILFLRALRQKRIK